MIIYGKNKNVLGGNFEKTLSFAACLFDILEYAPKNTYIFGEIPTYLMEILTCISQGPSYRSVSTLNPIPDGGGVGTLCPQQHISFYRFHRVRARHPKIHDFVSFDI